MLPNPAAISRSKAGAAVNTSFSVWSADFRHGRISIMLDDEEEWDRQSKEIAVLKDDIKLMFECSPGLLDQIKHRARNNVPSDSVEFVERCRSFLNRHAFPLTP
jgi:hypothetical protein